MKRTPRPPISWFSTLFLKRALTQLILFAFLANTIGPCPSAQAQEFKLPTPGVMVHLSPPLDPLILKGIKVHLDNPFLFDFILDKGDSFSEKMSSPNALVGDPQQEQLKEETKKLIKYFLASLTVPDNELWVNLSPYEKNRIIPKSFGQTEMGRDLLAEDYMLKQITASLIYPEDEIGKKFWQKVYSQAQERFGTTNTPINTFNKVWIIAQKARVQEKGPIAVVAYAHLKVMLEEDYFALNKNMSLRGAEGDAAIPERTTNLDEIASSLKSTPRNDTKRYDVNALGSQAVREIVIPLLEKEVNEGKNFSSLRQVYNSLILATWYKKKIKDSIIARLYEGKNKISGVQYIKSVNSKSDVELIYQRYLKAFKKGVYNYIKEETDPVTQEVVPRKYFSGGMVIDPAQVISYQEVAHFAQTSDKLIMANTAMLTRKGDRVGAEENVKRSVVNAGDFGSTGGKGGVKRRLGDRIKNFWYLALPGLIAAVAWGILIPTIVLIDKHNNKEYVIHQDQGVTNTQAGQVSTTTPAWIDLRTIPRSHMLADDVGTNSPIDKTVEYKKGSKVGSKTETTNNKMYTLPGTNLEGPYYYSFYLPLCKEMNNTVTINLNGVSIDYLKQIDILNKMGASKELGYLNYLYDINVYFYSNFGDGFEKSGNEWLIRFAAIQNYHRLNQAVGGESKNVFTESMIGEIGNKKGQFEAVADLVNLDDSAGIDRLEEFAKEDFDLANFLGTTSGQMALLRWKPKDLTLKTKLLFERFKYCQMKMLSA